jgi:mRNA interferase RelE/StbE
MRYSIEFQPTARKALDNLPRTIQVRIGHALKALAEEPHPPGSKKLSGKHDIWRLRVGDYRVLYTIESGRLVILVLKVGHRKDVSRS